MRYPLIAVLLVLICAVPVLAGQSPREVVVLVTMEGISLDRIADSNADFQRLIDSGAIGLMNNKTDAGQVFENNSVTIGAGTRGIGYDYAHYGFNASEVAEGENAGLIFHRNTGLRVPDSALVQTKLAAIRSINTYQRYDIYPGKLGSLLQNNAIHTSVYGNSDQGQILSRNAVTIAMNTQGWADAGNVSAQTLTRDWERPFGVKTNYEYILNAIRTRSGDRAFIVVEAGDGRRLEAARIDLLSERHAALRRTALGECGRFLTALNDYLSNNTDRYLLIFAVPTQASESFDAGDRLTPIILNGTGVPRGVLTSSTTKLPGVATNVDLAPTVLSFFRIEPDPSMIGSPVTAKSRPNAVQTLRADNVRMIKTLRARIPVLYGYVACVAICVLLAIFSVLLHGRPTGYFSGVLSPSFLRPALMSLMLAPAALWLEPALRIVGTLPSALFLAVATIGASIALNRWVKDLRLMLAVVALTNVAVVTGDLLFGNTLLRRTILSYDPIAGIRFYGLGNECAGVLMGASLLGVYALLDYMGKKRSWLVPGIIFAAIALIVGAPGYGSDFGGTITYLFAFGYAVLKARDTDLNLKVAVWMGGLGVLLLGGVIAANLFMQADQQTHIGRFFSQLARGDFAVFADTAVRKWSMNLRLIKYSVWVHFVYIFIIGLAILFHRPVGVLQRTLSRHPALNAGFMGILIGVIVAMLTNDSGIAMAATALLYLAPPLFMMVRQEMADEQVSSAQLTARSTRISE